MLNGMIKYIGTAVGVIGVEWFQSLPNAAWIADWQLCLLSGGVCADALKKGT